jgi:hypothetical protein
MRPASPLWPRILGYGGAVVLVAVAVTVVLFQLRAGTADPHAGGPAPSAGAPGTNGTPGTNGALGVPTRQRAPGGTGANPGSLGTVGGAGATGSTRCGSAAASVQRTGDSVKVSVTVPATGLVAAFVDAKGRGTLTKSVTAQGEPGPHVFEFTGVPAAVTKRVGVTVITEGGLRTCDLPLGP